MNNDKLIPIIEKAGLDASESKVYVAAVQLGKATIHDLARNAGLNRTSCYSVVERLKQKGLISQIKKGNKIFINPSSPDKLLQMQKENYDVLKKHMDDLKYIFKIAQNDPGVRFYEGTEGLKAVLHMITDEAKEVSIFGDGDAFKKAIPGWTENYADKRVVNKIKSRILLRGTDSAITTAKKLRKSVGPKNALTKIRDLPAAYDIVGGFDVYNQKVISYSFDEKNIAVVVESKTISTMMQTVFDILWSLAETYDTTLLR